MILMWRIWGLWSVGEKQFVEYTVLGSGSGSGHSHVRAQDFGPGVG